MESDRDPDLPIQTRERDLQELEPHQQRIERLANAYYGACERVARAIRTVKGYLSRTDDEHR